MTWTHALLAVVVGLFSGALNSALGGGQLLLYPALLSLGLPAVEANATSSVGIFPASLGGSWQYRRELAQRSRRRLARWFGVVLLGGTAGALLVVALPTSIFKMIIPWLIIFAALMLAVQPLTKRITARWYGSRVLTPALGAVSVYGGYFGAAQGMMVLLVLTLFDGPGLQRANAVKNVLVAAANLAASVVFIAASRVMWPLAVIVAVGAIVGGWAGGGLARRLPDWALRTLIVLVGLYGAYVGIVEE